MNAAGLRFALVVSRFNSFITENLLNGAIDAFLRHGGRRDDLTIVKVPGSFELPFTCKRLAEIGKFDGIVALGAVIKGETSHYEHVCAQAAAGVMQAGLTTATPITFGILTTDTVEQALDRAGTKGGNKGADSVIAAIEMASVVRNIDKGEL